MIKILTIILAIFVSIVFCLILLGYSEPLGITFITIIVATVLSMYFGWKKVFGIPISLIIIYGIMVKISESFGTILLIIAVILLFIKWLNWASTPRNSSSSTSSSDYERLGGGGFSPRESREFEIEQSIKRIRRNLGNDCILLKILICFIKK